MVKALVTDNYGYLRRYGPGAVRGRCGPALSRTSLDKLGVEITAYYATEIDKYAIQTTQHNYPDTVQLGDAFQVRDDDWGVKE